LVGLLSAVAGCGHLSGASVSDQRTAKGLRYYMARPQFLVNRTTTSDGIQVTLGIRRDPDLRYPQEVYLQQGWLSADIFDVQVTDLGLLTTVSGESADKSVESVKSVATFAVHLASTFAGTGVLSAASAGTEVPAKNAGFQVVAMARAQMGSSAGDCSIGAVSNTASFLEALARVRRDLGSQKERLAKDKNDLAEAMKGLAGAKDNPGGAAGAQLVAIRDVSATHLASAQNCFRTMAKEADRKTSGITGIIDGEVTPAIQIVMADLEVRLEKANTIAAANDLQAALFDGFLLLSPELLINELTLRDAREPDSKARDAIKSAKRRLSYLKDPLDPKDPEDPTSTGIDVAQKNVADAAKPCGTAKEVFDSLEVLVRIIEADLNCLLEKQTKSGMRNTPFIEDAKLAVITLQSITEFLLDPLSGSEVANKRARWIVDDESLDPRLVDETILHQTLRARDRLHEFVWRRAQLAATAKAVEKGIGNIYATIGKGGQIRAVLEERARLRDFLTKPVTGPEVRARTQAQQLLVTLDSTLAALLTVKEEPPEAITRTITPQLYWVKPYGDIPKQGDLGANPGDVVVIVRPLGGEKQ
jgi:hypothetical protein